MKPNTHTGFSLLEMISAMVIMTMLIAFAVPTMMKLQHQRSTAEERLDAIEAVGNLMAYAIHQPPRTLPDSDDLAASLEARLPEFMQAGEVRVTISPISVPPNARRLTIEYLFPASQRDRKAAIQLDALLPTDKEDAS